MATSIRTALLSGRRQGATNRAAVARAVTLFLRLRTTGSSPRQNLSGRVGRRSASATTHSFQIELVGGIALV
ncbi:hypothetical protein FEZ60_06615 [Rhodococcus sp. MS16]|uniref:hypothetical protein n=1 Tax=Rhodococcus sp. MS16 TaxID=2579941 RepID=UPI001562AE41|nr:hypothetical protein [Rhodococcus sp. MS16]NRI65212.1 hypothetical protein [Rhodococcus sp. MS16]